MGLDFWEKREEEMNLVMGEMGGDMDRKQEVQDGRE